MNQYDFCEDEMDEHIQTYSIPQSIIHSLRNSRVTHQNYQSVNDMNLCQNIYYVDSTNCSPRPQNYTNAWGKSFKNQEKIKKIIQQQQERILSQCTFKPKTNIKKTIKRDFNNFLLHQQAHIKKAQQNKQKMKQQLENKMQKITFQPKTNKASKYFSNIKNASVFDRLNNFKAKQDKKKYNDQNTFHPKINKKSKNLIRHQSVQQILYKDAQQRQMRQKNSKDAEKQNEIVEKKLTNFTSEQYVAQKFMKQYFYALQQLKIQVDEHFKIEKETFKKLLLKLRFLSPTQAMSKQSAINQGNLAEQAYEFISKYFVNARNVFVFLLAVMGVYNVNQTLVTYEPNLSLNQSQGRIINKKYNKLYNNRLYSQQKGQLREKNSPCTFKPQISKQSIMLAEKNRKILLEEASKVLKIHPELNKTLPQNGIITHAQFLILNKRMRDIEVETQRNAKVQNTIKQCTFKPKISTNSLALRRKSSLIESLTKLNKEDEQKNYQSEKILPNLAEKQPLKKNKPCLILDINFGDKQDQIVLKPEDIYRLPEIAKQYADKYYIDQESQIQLLQMLADQFNIILHPELNQYPC